MQYFGRLDKLVGNVDCVEQELKSKVFITIRG